MLDRGRRQKSFPSTCSNMEKELIFLKLGGAAITDKTRPETPRSDVIRRAAREIKAAAREARDFRLLLGHGSGSYGHPVAQKYGVHKGLAGQADWQGLAYTQAAAARLNRLVADIFLEEGIPVFPLQPSASARCLEGELVSLEVEPIREALDRGLVPLIWGDVAFDEVRGSCIISTEIIFAYLAFHLKPTRILLAGDMEGIFSHDPQKVPNASLIPRISLEDLPKLEEVLGGPQGADVTGGMAEKVRRMALLVQNQPNLQVRFFSALIPGLIQKALIDPQSSIGTLLEAPGASRQI